MTIRKIGNNKYRLYSKKTGKNLGTFNSLAAAKKHEGEVQYFKHHEDVNPDKLSFKEYFLESDDTDLSN